MVLVLLERIRLLKLSLFSVSYQLSQTGVDTVSLPLNQRVSDFDLGFLNLPDMP